MITGSAIEPGDAVIGLPSSGLHSNGYTLARSALEGVPMDDDRLGRPLGEVLLEPTEIYVKPVLELIASDVEVRGLAHITSGGLGNLLRLEAEVGYEIDDAAAGPAGLRADPGARRDLPDDEMHEVFNMGCGFCASWPRRTRRRPWSCCGRITRRRSGSGGRPPRRWHRQLASEAPLRRKYGAMADALQWQA